MNAPKPAMPTHTNNVSQRGAASHTSIKSAPTMINPAPKRYGSKSIYPPNILRQNPFDRSASSFLLNRQAFASSRSMRSARSLARSRSAISRSRSACKVLSARFSSSKRPSKRLSSRSKARTDYPLFYKLSFSASCWRAKPMITSPSMTVVGVD